MLGVEINMPEKEKKEICSFTGEGLCADSNPCKGRRVNCGNRYAQRPHMARFCSAYSEDSE